MPEPLDQRGSSADRRGASPAPRAGRRRRAGRFAGRAVGAVALAWGAAAISGCMNLSSPVDYLLNLGSLPHEAGLLAPADGVRRLVVLRHGLWRSAGSLWKLERALRDHGYEVLNESYSSTADTIEAHAEQMARGLEDRLAAPGMAGVPVELYFVGHSMGGVQICAYLAGLAGQPVRKPEACVFLATPFRGAQLLDKRKDWLLFRIFMGDQAALQLAPGHEIYGRICAPGCDSGVVYGAAGDGEGWNDDIPGDDDGTVALDEAQLPSARDRIGLRLGHTRISYHDSAVRQVLHFLRYRRFDHAAVGGR